MKNPNSVYYYHKLDKIQYAISILLKAQRSGIEDTLAYLEEREVDAANDLIEAEQAEQQNDV